MEIRILAVGGSYRRADDGVVIELYGRAEDGRSVTALYRGFRPYFHVVEPGPEVLKELGEDPKVKGLTERDLLVERMMRHCLKVTITFPFEVPAYRKRWTEAGYQVLAADIPFINRFYYDLDLGSYLRIKGEEAPNPAYGTDLVVELTEVCGSEPFPVRLKVLSIDIENSIKTGEIFMVGHSVGWLQLGDGGVASGSIVGDDVGMPVRRDRERDILFRLNRLVREIDPDIITGYNIDGYDIPHMLKRAEVIGGSELSFGRDGSAIEKMGYRSWRVRGRVVLDAWFEAKKAFRPKKETLEAVSRLVLGEGKDDVDTMRIEEEWENRRAEVVKYCERDSALALRILDRTQSVKKGMALSYVARLPLQDILGGTTSVLIDSILIRRADREGIGIPLTRRESKTDKIEGAYVHSVEPGLYKWVLVLDFRSMYPSLMIEHNICFTTLTSDPSAGSRSPIEGVYFVPSSVQEGLVPRILKGLMEDRKRAKDAMRSSTLQSDKDYYNGLQEAIKVLMNSFYGVFASYFYRFTDRSIGASITAFARESIMSIIRSLSSEGVRVIYSDTDSVFIESPAQDLERTVEFGRALSERFSKGATHLEFEKVFQSFFTHGKKKRYIGKQVWPSDDIVVRGYEMRRTDAFDLQSESLNELFVEVLEGRIDDGLTLSRDVIRRCRAGDVDVSSLVISRSVQEVEDDKIDGAYKNPDSLTNVQALRKAKDMGVEVVPGMKVSWVVVDGRSSPQVVEPYIDGRAFTGRPDYQYYAERLASTLSRVTEVFGVTEKELLTGASQSRIIDSFGTDAPARAEDASHPPRKGPSQAQKGGNENLDRWA